MANDFLATYTPLANDIATHTGLDPSVVLGIIDTETGGGQRVLGNNIFGISPGGQVARYPDVQTAAQAFVGLMQTPRYQAVAQAGSPAAQAAMLVRSGYNTANPNYAATVASKALNFGKQLGYQDGSGSTQQAAAPAPTSAPDYNDTPPAAAAPAAGKPAAATDRLIQELQQGATPPPAANGAEKPASATDRLIQELQQPPAPGALTGPPEKKQRAPYETLDNPMGDQGGMGGSSMPSTGLGRVESLPGPVRRIIQAGEEGVAGTEDTRNLLSRIFPPPPGLPDVVGQLLNPAIKGVGAIFRGGQQAAAEIAEPIGRMIPSVQVPLIRIPGTNMQFEGNLGGGPGLGRDVAALPEAFPTGGLLEAPRGPATAQQARNFLGQPITVADLTEAIRRSDINAPQNLLDQSRLGQPEARPVVGGGVPPPPSGPEGSGPGPGEPPPGPASGGGGVPFMITRAMRSQLGDMGYTADDISRMTPQGAHDILARGARAEQAAPQAAGAEATTAPIPDKTKAQTAADIRKDVAQTAADRAGPGPRDDNVYVEGIPARPEAFKNFSRQTALDHKYQLSKDPDYRTQIDTINDQRNEGMTDLIKPEMGDANTLADLIKQRKEFSPEEMGVFNGEKPVDPALLEGFRAKLQGLIDGPFSKRGGVRGILEEVYRTLFDKDGNIENMPSMLQGVRDNMTDWLDKKSGSDNIAKNAAAAQRTLTDLVSDLNPVMNSGAPKWDAWRQKWAEMSRPIDQQEFLQKYAPGRSKSIWDSKGNLLFKKVQQLLADTANAYDKPVHEAQSLTDAQIQKIVNIRNELEAEHFATTQGGFPGSPTHQLLERAAKEGGTSLGKTIAKLGGDAIIHGVGAYAHTKGVPFVNAAFGMYQSTRPIREQNRLARKQASLAEQAEAIKRNLLSQTGPTNYLNPPP